MSDWQKKLYFQQKWKRQIESKEGRSSLIMSQHPNSSSSCTNQFSRRKPDSVTPPLFLTLASRPASVNTLLLRAPRCSSLCPHSWGRPHHASLLRSRPYEDEPGPHWDRLLPQCWALSLSELTGSAHEGHKIYSGGFIYMDKKCNWFRDLQLDYYTKIQSLHRVCGLVWATESLMISLCR